MPVIKTGDYDPPGPNTCAGCGGKIADRYYLLAVDRQWHVHCLTCCECKLQLDSELTCFARDGNIYCKDDYFRLFAVKCCARCQRGIFSTELVMRARDLVFHLHCFTCAWCNAALSQGDYFGLRDNLVYCRAHYELLVHGENLFTTEDLSRSSPADPAAGGRPIDNAASSFPTFSTVGTGRKGRPRKRKSSDLGLDGAPSQCLQTMDPTGCNLPIDTSSTTQTVIPNGQTQRTKRMRTSFKHHQLRTMKSYFAINQNPDAKDLKQLAQKTGLSKRVLQVWFQNARAKWRRNNLKQQEPQQCQQTDMVLSVNSPGATSSFSEPSPCGVIGDGVPVSAQATLSLAGMDFENSNSMGALVSHRTLSTGHKGDALHLTSFHDLF